MRISLTLANAARSGDCGYRTVSVALSDECASLVNATGAGECSYLSYTRWLHFLRPSHTLGGRTPYDPSHTLWLHLCPPCATGYTLLRATRALRDRTPRRPVSYAMAALSCVPPLRLRSCVPPCVTAALCCGFDPCATVTLSCGPPVRHGCTILWPSRCVMVILSCDRRPRRRHPPVGS